MKCTLGTYNANVAAKMDEVVVLLDLITNEVTLAKEAAEQMLKDVMFELPKDGCEVLSSVIGNLKQVDNVMDEVKLTVQIMRDGPSELDVIALRAIGGSLLEVQEQLIAMEERLNELGNRLNLFQEKANP